MKPKNEFLLKVIILTAAEISLGVIVGVLTARGYLKYYQKTGKLPNF